MKIEVEAKNVIEREVKARKDTAYVYLPSSWAGKKVLIIEQEKGGKKK